MKNTKISLDSLIYSVLSIVLINSTFLFAQTSSKSEKDYKNNPEWISMMNNPNANYYETVKAFRDFFMDRFLPEEPWDRANEGGDPFEKEVGLEVENGSGKKSEMEKERERKIQNPNEPNYSEEVRAFKSWFYSIKPWVQSDGSIMNPADQQLIIKKQQSELKEIEKANGKK